LVGAARCATSPTATPATFSFRKKLALSASAGNLKNLEHIKKQQDAKAHRIKDDAEDAPDQIEALTYEERRQASEEGKLFGSVTSQDLASSSASTGSRSSGAASISTSRSRTLGET
jgi:ribosomal protein L9